VLAGTADLLVALNHKTPFIVSRFSLTFLAHMPVDWLRSFIFNCLKDLKTLGIKIIEELLVNQSEVLAHLPRIFLPDPDQLNKKIIYCLSQFYYGQKLINKILEKNPLFYSDLEKGFYWAEDNSKHVNFNANTLFFYSLTEERQAFYDQLISNRPSLITRLPANLLFRCVQIEYVGPVNDVAFVNFCSTPPGIRLLHQLFMMNDDIPCAMIKEDLLTGYKAENHSDAPFNLLCRNYQYGHQILSIILKKNSKEMLAVLDKLLTKVINDQDFNNFTPLHHMVLACEVSPLLKLILTLDHQRIIGLPVHFFLKSLGNQWKNTSLLDLFEYSAEGRRLLEIIKKGNVLLSQILAKRQNPQTAHVLNEIINKKQQILNNQFKSFDAAAPQKQSEIPSVIFKHLFNDYCNYPIRLFNGSYKGARSFINWVMLDYRATSIFITCLCS